MGKQKRKTRIYKEKGLIGTPSLDNGGKKNPVFAPGADLTEEEKEKLLKQTAPIEDMGTEELQRYHWHLHLMFRKIVDNEGLKVDEIVNYHSRVVDSLFERDITHPPPPDDGLDDNSQSFERNTDKQPNWTVPISKRFRFVSFMDQIEEREDVYKGMPWEGDDE